MADLAAAREERYALSPIQQSLLDESLATAWGERVGLMQVVWDLPEELDLAAFAGAWKLTTARHPILRTRLVWRGGGQPFQEVMRHVRVPQAAVDWSALPPPELERCHTAMLFADRRRGLDLERAPLLRVLVARCRRAHHRVILTLHHALFDGRTLLALVQEVFAGYDALRRGEVPDLPPAGPYRAYVEWLARQDYGAAEAFWRRALRGVREPSTLAVAPAQGGLPPARRQQDGVPDVWFSRDVAVWLSAPATARLMSFAGGLGLTLNTLLLAAWSLLLARYGAARDVLFGVVRTHRGAVPGGPAILGPIMASVPFHAAVDPAAALADWLQALRTAWLAMRAGDFAAPAQIREWSEVDRQAPLFTTLVLVETHEITERLRSAGGAWRRRSFQFLRMPRVPLSVYGYIEERLQLKLIFDPALFDAAAMQRLLGHLQAAIEAMPAAAGRPLRELPWLSAAERHQLLVDCNDTAASGAVAAGGDWQPVHRRFEERARRAPHALAVAGPGGAHSYAQVEESANRLARLLAARGAGPGVVVAVLLERSPEEMGALLAVLKTGAAFLPLEGTATERLDAILEDAQAQLLVSRSDCRPGLRFPARRIVDLDRAHPDLARQPAAPPAGAAAVPAAQAAYVIYTSGSTGRPKGVVVTHGGLANLVDWHLRTFAISAADRASRLAGLAFDASVWELWPYWSRGAAVILPPEDTRSAPPELRDWLVREGVTVAFAPTAIAERLIEVDWPDRPALRLLLTGGAALRAAPPAGLPFRLINNYGPTECSVVATSGEVAPPAPEATASDAARRPRPPAIGRPIGNFRLQLLDPDFRPVPIGVCGNLMIAGVGLAQGYLGRPALTAERFLPDPHGAPGERLYRSGDLARFLPDGAIEFLGRGDAQIKLRGFRIEPAEVEAALDRHPAVRLSALVCAGAEPATGKRLVAFLVPRPGASASDDDLAAFLRAKLPPYMIPVVYRWCDDLPLTANGKLDRKALEALAETLATRAPDLAAPDTPLERLLASLWEETLHVQSVGLHDDFFVLGGHSLHVMRLLSLLRQTFQRDIPPDLVFLAPTIARLIAELFPTAADRQATEQFAASLPATGAADPATLR
jgi:amino acid adenylation domain-containing protein